MSPPLHPPKKLKIRCIKGAETKLRLKKSFYAADEATKRHLKDARAKWNEFLHDPTNTQKMETALIASNSIDLPNEKTFTKKEALREICLEKYPHLTLIKPDSRTSQEEIMGFGVAAKHAIPKNAIICEYKGRFFDEKDAEEHRLYTESLGADINEDTYAVGMKMRNGKTKTAGIIQGCIAGFVLRQKVRFKRHSAKKWF